MFADLQQYRSSKLAITLTCTGKIHIITGHLKSVLTRLGQTPHHRPAKTVFSTVPRNSGWQWTVELRARWGGVSLSTVSQSCKEQLKIGGVAFDILRCWKDDPIQTSEYSMQGKYKRELTNTTENGLWLGKICRAGRWKCPSLDETSASAPPEETLPYPSVAKGSRVLSLSSLQPSSRTLKSQQIHNPNHRYDITKLLN